MGKKKKGAEGTPGKDIMSKVFLFDVETTGLDPNKHEIWQIAGKFMWVHPDGRREVRETVNWFLKPEKAVDQEMYDNPKLLPSGPEFWEDPKFHDRKVVWDKMKAFIDSDIAVRDVKDKYLLCGQNVGFDYDHFRAFYYADYNGPLRSDNTVQDHFGAYFWWPVIDTKTLMGLNLFLGAEAPRKFNLEALCEFFGIRNAKAHDALADIEATEQVVFKSMNIFRRELTKRFMENVMSAGLEKQLNFWRKNVTLMNDEAFHRLFHFMDNQRMDRLLEAEKKGEVR